jgi:hypothetical protein
MTENKKTERLDAWLRDYQEGTELKRFLTERMMEGITGLGAEEAARLAGEICDAIDECEVEQRRIEASEADGKSRTARIQEAIASIAEKCNQKREDVTRAVLGCLNRGHHAYLERVSGEKAEPFPLENVPLEREQDEIEAVQAAAGLMESTVALQEGEVCDNIFHDADGKERAEENIELPAVPLVKKALESEHLSAEEKILKKLLAGDGYIEMKMQKDAAGSPMYVAIQGATMSVARIKALIRQELAREHALRKHKSVAEAEKAAERERKKSGHWMQSAYESVIFVAARRALQHPGEWLGKHVLSVPVALALAPVYVIFDAFGIPVYEINRKICGKIGKYAGIALSKPLKAIARRTWPMVQTVAKKTVEAVKVGVQAVAKGVRKAVTVVKETTRTVVDTCAKVAAKAVAKVGETISTVFTKLTNWMFG